MTPDLTHEHQQGHTHDHEHQVLLSDPTLRVKALESLLVEKRIVDRARKEAWADAYRHTPHGKPVELRSSSGNS